MSGEIIIVGTGFSGAVLAREIAEKLGRRVKVYEKRSRIGGNMYDEYDSYGVLIQKYGPHIISTNRFSVIKYLMRFGNLFEHDVKMLSYFDGHYLQLPFNFLTVRQLVGAEKSEKLYAKFRDMYAGRDRVPILELCECGDANISEYANMVYEKFFRSYSAKMWGIPADKIDRSVLDRTPMAMGYDERYANKDFQYLPKDGYVPLISSMFNHPDIEVKYNVDALEHISFEGDAALWDGENADCIVFTGALDELFGCRYGDLPYRSFDFKYEHFDKAPHLPIDIVSYPQVEGYTRSTEYNRLMFSSISCEGSSVVTEYPIPYKKGIPEQGRGGIPCYPTLTAESIETREKYQELAKRYGNLFLCGRLAEFRYYNMDDCIENALMYFGDIERYLGGLHG